MTAKKPITLIPMALDPNRRTAMVLSSRKWKPEPGWCGHGRRTWLLPTPGEHPTHAYRLHGTPESWGVLVEVDGCARADRLRRDPAIVDPTTIRDQGPSAQGRADANFSNSRGGHGS